MAPTSPYGSVEIPYRVPISTTDRTHRSHPLHPLKLECNCVSVATSPLLSPRGASSGLGCRSISTSRWSRRPWQVHRTLWFSLISACIVHATRHISLLDLQIFGSTRCDRFDSSLRPASALLLFSLSIEPTAMAKSECGLRCSREVMISLCLLSKYLHLSPLVLAARTST